MAVRRSPASDNGGGTGCAGSRLISSLQILAGLEVRDALRRHVHAVAGPGVAAPVRLAAPEPETAEAAEFHLLPSVQRLDDAAEHGVDDDFGVPLREAGGVGHLVDERRLRQVAFGHGLVFRRKGAVSDARRGRHRPATTCADGS